MVKLIALVLATLVFSYVYSSSESGSETQENEDKVSDPDTSPDAPENEDKASDPNAGQDDVVTLSQLPLGIKEDFIKILSGGANAMYGSCLGVEPNYDLVELLLYTNYNTEANSTLNPKKPKGIDFKKPLFLLTHGWLSGVNGYKIKEFKNKYVEVYGSNVIFVNWQRLAWIPYTAVFCNIPFMARHVAKFLCRLHKKHGYDLSNVHMIGHSFGAQFSGHTGKAVQEICGTMIGRITGLDPAGPIYQFLPDSNRLAPLDAGFVEVVHSGAGIFGMLSKCGTVDYYLNCGTFQPGCIIPQDFSKIPETSIFLLACIHMRAIAIWPYVLESKEFKGKSCQNCPGLIIGTCVSDVFGANFATMGHTYTQPMSDSYNVLTGPYPPYSLGCTPHIFQGCT